jgi:hypothetical protein
MSDQLAQLAACSANFAFLAQVAPDLGGDGASAESYIYLDPDAAVARARRFAETLAKKLLPAPPTSSTPNFGPMVNQLHNAQVIPQDVYDRFEKIRVHGNAGVHGRPSSNANALESVRACFDLAVWWYRRETGIAVAHGYTTPAPTGTAMELLQAAVARVEARLDDLHAPHITISAGTPAPHRWQGGLEVRCGQAGFLLHDPVTTTAAPDRSWTFMQAAGQRVDGPATAVWLQGLHAATATAGAPLRDGLRRQAELLRRHAGRAGLPKLAGQGTAHGVQVVAATRPAGTPWATVLGDGRQPLDPMLLGMALQVLADVAATLSVLHRDGSAHLALGGSTVLLARGGRTGVLSDLGLAGFAPALRTAGPYRAPEQSAGPGRAGPPTDVYQLSALLHHTCTGASPSGGRLVPLGAVLPALPAEAAAMLAAALDRDPTRRPTMPQLAPVLRTAGTQVAAGVQA